jgi:hypothetical protein
VVLGKFSAVKLNLGIFESSHGKVRWYLLKNIQILQLRTVAAFEISDRKDLNTLYKFRNLISVNRIFMKDYKVSVSICLIRSESCVTFEMPELSDLQKCA